MSLEAKIEELTAKIGELIETMGGETKPAGKAPAKASGKTPAKSGGKKPTSPDAVAEAFGTYLASGSTAEKKKARQVVKAVVDKFDVERISALDASDFDEALSILKEYQAGEDPLEIFEEDEDEGML